MSQTFEHLTPYISTTIQTHGFQDDLLKSQIRVRTPRRTFTGELERSTIQHRGIVASWLEISFVRILVGSYGKENLVKEWN